MELEHRVKTIEHEMKILKNEIQRTLLDIQEQVLVHYYPTLRTEETSPPEGTIQAMEGVRAKQMAPPFSAPLPAVKRATPEEIGARPSEPIAVLQALDARPKPNNVLDPTITPVELNPPVLKKVTLNEIREGQDKRAPLPHPTDPDTSVKLFQWALSSAPKIGSERVAKIVEAFCFEGTISTEAKDVLMRIASLTNVSAPAEMPVNDMLDEVMKLKAVLGPAADPEPARLLIEEATLG